MDKSSLKRKMFIRMLSAFLVCFLGAAGSMFLLTKEFGQQAVIAVNNGKISQENSALDYHEVPSSSSSSTPTTTQPTSPSESNIVLPNGVSPSDSNLNIELPKIQRAEGDSNYLLVGVDSRAGANGAVGAGNANSVNGTRADTIMVAHIPKDRKKITVLSFPRDLSVTRPECQQWNNTTNKYSNDTLPEMHDVKINSAYAVGGPRCLVGVISKLTGLELTHFVGIDFSGFEQIVDNFGGVEVCSPVPLHDEELGTILAKPGKQVINGKTALNYVRARKIPEEGQGDYSRIRRQQLFLSSMMNKVMSTDFLSSPNDLIKFVKTGVNSTFGENLDFNELQSLLLGMKGKNMNSIKFITVPTKGANSNWNEIVDNPKLQNILDNMNKEETNNVLDEALSKVNSNTNSNNVPKPAPGVSKEQDNKGVKIC